MEEANIIINTLNPDTTYNLLNPDGYGYIQAEMDAMSIKAKTFTVIKDVYKRQGFRYGGGDDLFPDPFRRTPHFFHDKLVLFHGIPRVVYTACLLYTSRCV